MDELPLVAFAKTAGVCERWLRRQCVAGQVRHSIRGVRSYYLERELVDRMRLRYLRMRRHQAESPMGMVRGGVAYRHDGQIRR
jgi:hypothetical protein